MSSLYWVAKYVSCNHYFLPSQRHAARQQRESIPGCHLLFRSERVVEVSNEWLSGSEQECSDNSMRETHRKRRRDEDSGITSLPTQPPVQGYDLSALPLSTTQQKRISLASAWVSTVGFLWDQITGGD